MISLLVAAALAQAAPGAPPVPTVVPVDPCHAAAAAAGREGCPAWRRFQEDAEGNLYVDPASVVPGGDGFEANLWHVFTRDDEDGVRSVIFRFRFDCRRRTAAALHITAYSTAGIRGLDGAVPSPEDRPQRAQRGTVRADILDAYCPRATG